MSSTHGQMAYSTSNTSVNATNNPTARGSNASLSGQTNHAGMAAATSLVLSYDSTDPTVDYDTDVTPLYEAIGDGDWEAATEICEKILGGVKNGGRNDAATWVVRYNHNFNAGANGGSIGTTNILWRFLPIHSTCALSPPHTFLRLLIQLHPPSVRTRDHQGLLPLHYACGARCSRECIYTLLMSFPQGSMVGDPRGMLPLHYLGQWGPSMGNGSSSGNSGIVEMMLVATGDLANTRDKDGNTPLKLAQNANYPNHTEVANQIANHIMRKNLHLSNSIGGSSPRWSSPSHGQERNKERYASFEDDITMDSHMQGIDFSARKGSKNHGAASHGGNHHGYSHAMVSFGDLLEDEERMDGNGSGGRRGDVKEVRDTNIEISLGGVRTMGGSNTWNKLGISPVHNPNNSKLSQHMASNNATAGSKFSWENRSITSDPLTGNNQRVVSSPRRIDEAKTDSNGSEFHHPTDPTPKMGPRSFSWDAQDPVTSQAEENAMQPSVSVANIVDKYMSPRHSRDPSARQGLPPMSPRFSSSTQRSNHPLRSTDFSDSRDDKESTTREGVDPTPEKVLIRSDSQSSVSKEDYDKLKMAKEQSENQMRMLSQSSVSKEEFDKLKMAKEQSESQMRMLSQSSVSKEEFDKLRMAKEQSESQMRMLKIEKDQTEIQMRMSIEEKLREVQSSHEARLEEEKKRFIDRESKLSEQLDEGKKRIAELEYQLNELRTVEGKNSSEREASLSRQLEAERKRTAELESQLKEMERKIAANDDSYAELTKEKRRSSELEAQVTDLQVKVDAMQKTHGEAVYTHLQEVRSLRTSLEKATLEIEKSKAQSLEQSTKSVTEVKAVEKKYLDDLSAKEEQWKEERAKLEAQFTLSSKKLEEMMPKLQEHDDWAAKESQWKEDRVKLEGQIRTLTETSWGVQNSEYALKAEIHKKEQAWEEERAKLEAEVKHLKEVVKESGSSGGDGYSITSSLMQNNSFGCEPIYMKMQLESAIREAEEMRKFNSAIRKEHGETIADFESELEKERAGKKEMLSQIVSLQYKVSQLESDLEERDGSVEVALYGMRSKYRGSGSGSMDDVEQTRRTIDAVRKEAEGRERSLREQLNQARRQIKQLEDELYEKSIQGSTSQSTEYSYRQQLNEARDQVHRLEEQVRHLEERERSVRKELEDASSAKFKLNATRDELSKKEEYHREVVNQLETKIRELEESQRYLKNQLKDFESLKKELENASSAKFKLDATRDELSKKEEYHREEVNQLETKIRHLEERERFLKNQLKDFESEGMSSDQERVYNEQLRSTKSQLKELQGREDTYLKEIRDLKKQISELEANDHGLDAKLWEAKKTQQWALQEKEDEFNTKIREIKKEYENTLVETQNLHLKELRDVKREFQSTFREKEDSYMQQLRDAKRREQALQDREDELIKQMNNVQMKSSLDDLDIEGMLKKKDEEFTRLLEDASREKAEMISELTYEVDRLERELRNREDAESVKKELSECKKELEKQRRKHKSEVNKLNNTLDLQKSKESRLQSHIKSMESQITGMVSDYEARLEEAYYANLRS